MQRDGVRLTFVTGGAIELRGKGGRIIRADGIHQVDADGSSHIFVRADSRRFTPEQLTKHEDFHDMAANNRGLLLDMVEALYDTQGEEGVARMVDAYVVALDGCYGSYTEGMTEDEQRELAMLYIEEIFADQYAGMNRSSSGARQAVETAGDVTQRFAGDIENARQNRAGIDRRNGLGTRLSIKNMQNLSWEEQLRTHRHSDTLVVQNDVDSFLNGRVNNKPLAVPVSIVTKAQSGKDTDHSVSNPTIQQLPLGMKNAVYVIDSKSRSSIVYVTNLRENKKLLTVAFAKDRHFDNDDIHQATSIHLREKPNIMLEKLGPEDKVYIRKNELDKVPGSPLQLGTLKAQVEFIDDIVTEVGKVVKRENDAVDWEGNREQRLSVSDEDEENDRAGGETEESDSSASLRSAQNDRVEDLTAGMGATSSASQSEAPSPQGEGSGRETRRADVGIGPYEDEVRPVTAPTEDEGRPMTAPTEERGRQSAVPASDKEGRNRNKESVWIHQLIPYSILFIPCCLLHITFYLLLYQTHGSSLAGVRISESSICSQSIH